MAYLHRKSSEELGGPLSVTGRDELTEWPLQALERAVCGAAQGVYYVQGTRDVAQAALRHLVRRLRAQGRTVLYGERGEALPALLDALRRRGDNASVSTQQALERLRQQPDTVLVLDGLRRDSWDAAVLEELAPTSLIYSGEELPLAHERFALPRELQQAERAQWLGAVLEQLREEGPRSLPELERWLESRSAHDPARLDPSLQQALRTLGAVGAPLRPEELAELLPAAVAAQCAQLGQRDDGDWLHFASSTEPLEAAPLRHVATSLERLRPHDPWALAHAGSLWLRAHDATEAHRAFTAALAHASEPAVRREVFGRIDRDFDALTDEARAGFVLEATQLALEGAESELALDWLRRLGVVPPALRARRNLLLGCALAASGDTVAAKVALDQARHEADEALHPAIVAELAELHGARGEGSEARRWAEQLTEQAPLELQMRARNVLGKLLLSASEWDAANQHFATDALRAESHGLHTAAMRASLNRGIALLSMGRLDDAERQFHAVLRSAEAHHDVMALAYALPNLAVATMRKHDYGQAHALWERAARTLRGIRGRLPGLRALVHMSLADMRLRLGLLDQAKHLVSFARRGGGTAELASVTSWLDITDATVALRQGDTQAARRMASQALLEAQRAGDVPRTLPALRLLIRIALEDGDLSTAERWLEQECAPRLEAATAAGRAEVAVLRAALARAQGASDSLRHAEAALPEAQQSGDEELIVEALTFLALGLRDSGQHALAHAHAQQAATVRDGVADTLSGPIRASYIAKRENVVVQRLLSSLSATAAPSHERPRATLAAPSANDAAQSDLVGESEPMFALRATVRRVARSQTTVLIHGESGTGKELVAAALHQQSERSDGPLVTVNCAALVESLLLSELFGHEKGAFTGAVGRRRGRFELADGGTLFLDEIGDISPRTQVALLRVLQERTFERVGGTTPVQVNVRVVCATHRNLGQMVERGEFREDLYYRLCGVTLSVPSLRQRLSDLPGLSAHLLARIAQERGEPIKHLSRDALDVLARHRWPGNVRELENVLRTLSLFSENTLLTASDVISHLDAFADLAQQHSGSLPVPPPTLRGEPTGHDDDGPESMAPPSVQWPLAEHIDTSNATGAAYAQVRTGEVSLFDLKRKIERDCIQLALNETGGNITHAAALLGMKRPRLSQLVKQYQLTSEEP